MLAAICSRRPTRPRPTGAASRDPTAVLAAARQALGGEKKLAAVKSFTATGRTRQVRGDNLVPIEFELFVELPDKYFKKDEIPAQETGASGSGFNGEDLLVIRTAPAAAGPREEAADDHVEAGLHEARARHVRGIVCGVSLTFTYVGQAEAPQGKADVLDAKGPDNFTLRYFINTETHLPVMVTWKGPLPGRGGRPGGPGMPPGAAGPGRGAPPRRRRPPRWSDTAARCGATGGRGAARRRGAAGTTRVARLLRRLSRRRRHAVPVQAAPRDGADTTEETTFDRFRINPKIDPKKFEVRK